MPAGNATIAIPNTDDNIVITLPIVESIAIPFGFFPFSSSYSSGFIMPTYGDEMNGMAIGRGTSSTTK